MTNHFHAVVYLDHAEALVFSFAQDDVTEHRILKSNREGNIHHKAGTVGSGHAHNDRAYFDAIAESLHAAKEILILGHGNAKTDFARFIREERPALAPRIMGVETVDHPTRPEIIAVARKYFKSKDQTTPQL